MKVILHPLFVVVLVVAFIGGFGWIAAALLFAVLVHEFSHMLVAAWFGVRTDRLRLLPFGAEVSIDCTFLPRDKKILILLGGPIGNIVLAIILSSLLWLFPQAFLVVEVLIIANAVPGILNLLPIYPLDGGKILYLLVGERKWVMWWSNIFFCGLFIASCLFFFSVALLLMCAMMVVCINFDLRATSYKTYIKTLDKFVKKRAIIRYEEKN
jgi:stage IV sporulation protein FB